MVRGVVGFGIKPPRIVSVRGGQIIKMERVGAIFPIPSFN